MKYTRYAIGEILLVVIGILIALQVNNWNEDRKKNFVATYYKERLLDDLKLDTAQVNRQIRINKVVIERIENYFKYFEKSNVPIDLLIDSALNVNFGFRRYFPMNYTFTDMQSTGNMDLLNEPQRNAFLKLTQKQDFLPIVLEKIVSDIKQELHEVSKHIDTDKSRSDFYIKLGSALGQEEKIMGLKHRHNALKYALQMYGLYQEIGSDIIKHSEIAMKSLNMDVTNIKN